MKLEISSQKRILGSFFIGLGLLALMGGSTRAGNVVQDFYVPLPEAQIYAANNAIVAGTGSTIFSTISIHVVSDNTVIYYDQWEDGYEVSLGSPTQSTTQIWGDGNDAHGIPPGMVHNPLGLPAGTIITLTNAVVTQPRNPAVIQYDGRDHIGATRPIVVTRAHWPSTTGTVIAGAVSVLSTAQWGTNYVSPVGQNMTNGLMSYVGLFVQAEQNGTAVVIDPTGTNGAGVTNILLNQGESYLYNGGILKGARASASAPVQADLVIGHKNASYAVDWFNLHPVTSWGSTYYTPVGSAVNGQPAYVYLYNPNTNALNLKVTTKVGVSTVTVPGTNGVTQFTMPASSGASFVATNGQAFYAICTVNASPSADTTWNWGFSLVPTQILTTEEDVGWAPGSSDGTANGSPVWVTPLAATKLYVAYGANTNYLTDPAGGKYNTNFNLTAFQSLKIYDPSKNQTGMRIYTLDGTLITAAWGEDSDVAGAGNPYIDAGYTVLPFPVPTLTKTVANLSNPGQPVTTNGTLLLYTVTIGNNNLVPLEGIVLRDLPSTRVQYVANSTTNFSSLSTNAVADKTGGVFPLLLPGYTNGIIQAQSSVTFTYFFTVTNNLGSITNLATIPSSIAGGGLITSLTANSSLSVTNTYVAPVINFTDTNGVVTNAYAVGLTNIYVTVIDSNANLSPTTVDTLQVTVLDTNTGDYQVMTLTETGTNTSVFRNTAGLPSSATSGLYPNDGILNGASGNGLVVTYIAGTGTAYTAAAALTGSSGGGGGGGGSGSSSALTKQLYLNSSNGTAQALNRFNPAVSGGTTSNSVDIGSGSSGVVFAVDSTTSGSTNSKNTLIISHTTAGQNRLMLVGVSLDNYGGNANNTVSGITYNGQSLGRVASAVSTSASTARASSDIWCLTNPPTGTYNVIITLSQVYAVAAGVITFTGVDTNSPFFSTNGVSSGNATNAISGTITNASVTGNFVFSTLALGQNTNSTVWPGTITPGAGQASQWGGVSNVYFTSYHVAGAASISNSVASSVTNSWSWPAGSAYAITAVSIAPAAGGSGTGGPATNATSFVQIPAFNAAFTIPSNSVFYITNYITLTNGTFTPNPDVTALLQTNGVTFLTLTNPTYSTTGLNTNLVWTNTLSADLTIPAGTAITYVVSNNVSGTAFHVNYGSSSRPSVILLPASPSTVISIDNFGIYDAPNPGGNLVSSPVAGTPMYIRATVSDPFGNYDISSVGLNITAPGGGVTSVNASVVATTTTNAIYEYAWTATTAVGNYSIAATANEGTEGITDTAVAAVTTSFLDQGTPNTTTFTSGDNGASTNAYPLNNGTACVLVQDLSANTNPNVADAVTVTVSSSAGGSIQVTLIETGTNTGSFANCFTTTTNLASANSSTLYAPSGAVLTANYSSLTSPAFQSSASAIVQPAPGFSSVAVTKTVVSPTGGQALLSNQVTYNVQVLNNGSTTLSGLVVTDSYPSQLTFTNASPAPAVTNLVTRLLIWTNLGPFAPGQGTNLTVTFTTTNASPATNRAWAYGGTLTNLVTNSVPLTILNPAVTVFKTVLNPVATNQIGSNVVFQIVITNSGNTTIPTLPLEDNFSGACFQFVSNNIVSTNAAAITGNLPSSGAGSLVWTNLAPTNGLAPGGVITNDVTLLVTGQGYPANNTAIVDYALDTNGLAVPASSSSVNVTNAAASISGYVYNDPGHTGTYAAGDAGLSGVTVSLYTDINNIPGALVGSTTTAANGSYQFLNLGTNNYLVVETLLPGYVASSAINQATNLTALIAYTNVNFFAYVLSVTNYASISGSVTNDLNWNGVASAGEPGLPNVTINLVQDLNSNGLVNAGEPVVATATTDTNGNYSFIDLTPGHYVIQEAVPYGYYATNVALGANSAGFVAATNALGVVTNFTQIGLVLTNGQNSLNNNFLAGQYQLSGTVLDDTNGLSDNLVNGAATNATGALIYVNLLNTSSNVLASVLVATNGSYVFTNLVSGTYLLQLSANAGTVGAAAPAMVLPVGWVNTGESTNGTITGNTNGLLTVQLGTVLTNANFGVDALPTSFATNATYVNPGGANTMVVPGLTGTDPEQGILGGTTNRVLITTVPGNATLSYNGVGVTAGQTITNYNPSLLTVNPNLEGATVVTFNFEIEDAAGEPSASAAAATVTFTGVSLSGTVYDDINGLTDGLVNGVATNTLGVPLYANAISAGGTVLASVPVATNGLYTITNLSAGIVTVQLSTNAGSVGLAMPATVLPANWVNTGESTNGVSDGVANGLVTLTVVSSPWSNVNFGMAQPVTIGGYTWLDVNHNGLQDPGEPALGNVTVVLYQTNGLSHAMTALATNLSNLNGQYVFANLPPGSYQLQFTPPAAGYTNSPAGQGTPANDSAPSATTGYTALLTFAAGTSDLTESAGFEPNSTAVTGVALRAYVNQGQAWISWQTYNEAGLLAFDLTRCAVGQAAQDMTPDWVFASGLDLGATYSVPDPGAPLPGNYTYHLFGYYDDGTIQPLASVQVQLAGSTATNSGLQVLSFEITGGTGLLRWSGGQPPYVVEQSGSLSPSAVWRTVGITTNATLLVPLNGQAGFFRVQTSGNPN